MKKLLLVLNCFIFILYNFIRFFLLRILVGFLFVIIFLFFRRKIVLQKVRVWLGLWSEISIVFFFESFLIMLRMRCWFLKLRNEVGLLKRKSFLFCVSVLVIIMSFFWFLLSLLKGFFVRFLSLRVWRVFIVIFLFIFFGLFRGLMWGFLFISMV